MGLKRDNSAVYLTIFEGKIVQRVKNATETSRERINKENEKVNEEVYGSISGRIVALGEKTHEKYGTSLLIYIEDDRIYCLQCLINGQYGVSFLKALPNADLSKSVELVPSQKEVNGKPDQVLYIKQKGEDGKFKALKFAFTKDNPNGMPEPKQVEYQGALRWDFFQQTKFLHDVVFMQAKEHLKDNGGIKIEEPKEEPAEPEQSKGKDGKGKGKGKGNTSLADSDDLPF
jgi:hypothetical protein